MTVNQIMLALVSAALGAAVAVLVLQSQQPSEQERACRTLVEGPKAEVVPTAAECEEHARRRRENAFPKGTPESQKDDSVACMAPDLAEYKRAEAEYERAIARCILTGGRRQ